MVEAVARAAEVPATRSGGRACSAAIWARRRPRPSQGGVEALRAVGLEVGRPVQPMLAAPGDDVDGALAKTGPAAIEYKLDGARLQVHRRGDEVRAFTRSLDDITARVPEVVEAVLALPRARSCSTASHRAEARRAAHTPSRSRRAASAPAAPTRRQPLTPLFFDVLHVDGEDLIDRPGAERAAGPRRAGAGAEPRAAGAGRRCRPRRTPSSTRLWRRDTRACS
jgi:DNA ligase-1